MNTKGNILVYAPHRAAAQGDGEWPFALVAALQKSCGVTLATDRPDLMSRVAETCGVPVDQSRLSLVRVPPPGGGVLATCRRMRALRRLAREADAAISAAGFVDFGRPAHHFVGFGDVADAAAGAAAPMRIGRMAASLARTLMRVRPAWKVARDPRERVHPSSEGAARLLAEGLGPYRGRTVHPPTFFRAHVANPLRNPLRVVWSGRVEPGERIEDVIDIVQRARALSGWSITLTFSGEMKRGPFADRLLRLEAARPWLEFKPAARKDFKTSFLFSGSYTVHASASGEFSVPATESLKAGLIPLVAAGSGADEVVGDPDLAFATNDDAARILARLVSDDAFRTAVRSRCEARAQAFSREAYLGRLRETVSAILFAPGA